MATGTATFLWYFLCCFFTTVVIFVAMGLVVYGDRKNKKRRASARSANQARESEAPETRVDPDGPAR